MPWEMAVINGLYREERFNFDLLDELNSTHTSTRHIAFLETLISRNSGTITTNVYRKSTHTDRYVDFKSHHDRKHKISTVATLLH